MAEWTEERIEQLTAMHGTKATAAQIAKTLGGISRSGVLGKIRRLGLAIATGARPKPEPIPPVEILHLVPEPEPEPAHRVAMTALTDNTCRFPIGDVGTPDFGFCGRIPRHHSPYCDEHHKRCFVPLAPRRHAASESGGSARNARALEEVA